MRIDLDPACLIGSTGSGRLAESLALLAYLALRQRGGDVSDPHLVTLPGKGK